MNESEPKKANTLLLVAVVFFIFSLITTIVVATRVVYDVSSKSCTFNGVTYKNGEGFMDDCNSCSCQDGEVSCTTMACEDYDQYPDEFFDEGFEDLDDLDGLSGACMYEDVFYGEGDEFTAMDGCNTCLCSGGEVSCTDMACGETQ